MGVKKRGNHLSQWKEKGRKVSKRGIFYWQRNHVFSAGLWCMSLFIQTCMKSLMFFRDLRFFSCIHKGRSEQFQFSSCTNLSLCVCSCLVMSWHQTSIFVPRFEGSYIWVAVYSEWFLIKCLDLILPRPPFVRIAQEELYEFF